MPADVAQRERTEDCIADRVQQDIRIRVAVETALVRHGDTAQHERPAFDERMDVEPVADPHGATTSGSSAARILGGIGTGRSVARSTHT